MKQDSYLCLKRRCACCQLMIISVSTCRFLEDQYFYQATTLNSLTICCFKSQQTDEHLNTPLGVNTSYQATCKWIHELQELNPPTLLHLPSVSQTFSFSSPLVQIYFCSCFPSNANTGFCGFYVYLCVFVFRKSIQKAKVNTFPFIMLSYFCWWNAAGLGIVF